MSNKSNNIIRVPFSLYSPSAMTSGSGALNLQPSNFPRVLSIADSFDLFRLGELSYRIHPPQMGVGASSTTHTVPHFMAFFPGITDTTPTPTSISENIQRCISAPGMTVPTAWVHVPKEMLRGPLPWYKTVNGSTDPVNEYPGTIYYGSTGSESVLSEIQGVFEFKGPAPTGATPMMKKNVALLRERQRLLDLLSGVSLNTGQTGEASLISSALPGLSSQSPGPKRV